MNSRMTGEWFRAIVESAPDSILIVDREGKIVFANERIEVLFGYQVGELIGSDVEILVADELKDQHRRLSQEYMFAPQVRPMGKARNLSGRHKDGHLVPVEISLSPNHSQGEFFIIAIVRDVSARRQMERQITESERNFRTFFEMSPAGVALVSQDRTLNRVNGAFLSLLGFKEAREVLGKEVWETIIVDDRPRFAALLKELSLGSPSQETDLRVKRKDGREIWVRVSVNLIHDSIICSPICFCIFFDISTQKEIERSLTDRANDLQKSNQKLESFASVASHDLRAPARRAATFMQMFMREYGNKIDERGREYLGFAVTEANKMQAMVDDLLVYSNVCKTRPELNPISLIKVVGDTLEILKPEIEEKRAKVTFGFLPRVMGNELQLRRLFSNLISNSLKFNKGRPIIHISSTDHREEHIVCVRDNGVGIPAGQIEKIFDIFYRAHSEKEFPGTGIGLASCKQIMENHGGLISAMSEVNEGSTFVMTFPRQLATSPNDKTPRLRPKAVEAEAGSLH